MTRAERVRYFLRFEVQAGDALAKEALEYIEHLEQENTVLRALTQAETITAEELNRRKWEVTVQPL